MRFDWRTPLEKIDLLYELLFNFVAEVIAGDSGMFLSRFARYIMLGRPSARRDVALQEAVDAVTARGLAQILAAVRRGAGEMTVAQRRGYLRAYAGSVVSRLSKGYLAFETVGAIVARGAREEAAERLVRQALAEAGRDVFSSARRRAA